MISRRHFLAQSCYGVGAAALATLLDSPPANAAQQNDGTLRSLHFAPRAKRVIFLHQSGAPSQMDLFDYKPMLQRRHGEELPESIRMGQRLTTMTADQAHKPLVASPFKFVRHGKCGAEMSELLPHTASVVDELCIIRSLHTEAINHDPAITFLQTGAQQPGRPSMGAWISYGLGSEAVDLPAYVVFISGGQTGDQPLFGRLWGAGFLPSAHQGVKFRAGANPVLYLQNPPGVSSSMRGRMVSRLNELNRIHHKETSDPEIETRIRQFELAAQMQLSVPRLADLSDEPASTFALYGEEARQPGTYAAHCLLARRLIERGVRFVQLYHRGWDHHLHLPSRIREKCRQTDQPSAALVRDLKNRGLLDDTLVIWIGEFGRTAYCQGKLETDDFGRDHHPRCFSAWLAGGGVKPGFTLGATDEFSYNIAFDAVHVHDLQATILYCLGIDHEKLTFRFQGRDYRLTDVSGEVVHKMLA